MADVRHTVFRRSSYCAAGTCVEVALDSGEEVMVRDGKQAAGATLRFTVDEWEAFIAGVKAGEFDI